MDEAQVDDLLAQYEELIRWLARTYGDNDPIWPYVDPVTNQELLENRRLAATWARVVRGTDG